MYVYIYIYIIVYIYITVYIYIYNSIYIYIYIYITVTVYNRILLIAAYPYHQQCKRDFPRHRGILCERRMDIRHDREP
jgi:hypothetical protein